MFFARSLTIGSIAALAVVVASNPVRALPLSPGDRLRLFIPGEEGLPDNERFSATYEVNVDGNINIPYLPPLRASGKEVPELEQNIKQALLSGGFFQRDFLRVSLEIFEWAAVQVTVGGAVFYPGRVLINQTDSKGRDLPAAIATLSGDYPAERYLTNAIQAVGGVTPNANIEQVRLIRGGQEQQIDLSGVFTGAPVNDIALIAGDQVVVPELDRAQNQLVRLSQITPDSIRVYLSNLSDPNATTPRADQLPYGSRFSQAVVAANCLGGSSAVNANRKAILVQTNRVTGETQTFESPVENLVKQSSTNPEVNPFLMPEDSIACYDSTASNVGNVFNLLGNIFNPIRALQQIFGN